jgi:hypothetical protein
MLALAPRPEAEKTLETLRQGQIPRVSLQDVLGGHIEDGWW